MILFQQNMNNICRKIPIYYENKSQILKYLDMMKQ